MSRTDFLTAIRNQPELDLKQLIDSFRATSDVNFIATRTHLLDIYENRYGRQLTFEGDAFEGMQETVEGLASSPLSNVRLIALTFTDGECALFTAPDYSTLLGYIVYPNKS